MIYGRKKLLNKFLISCSHYDSYNFTILREGRRLKQKEISIFSKFHKGNNKNNKDVFTFLIFYLLCSSIFLSDFIFYKRILCFIMFVLSLCPFRNFVPGWSVYMFFSFFFYHGMNFYLCLFDRDEFIPEWNFIPTKICKQEETFHHRQGWFHPGTNFIPGRSFTYKDHLNDDLTKIS